jgi:hypothetical protein
MSPLPPRFNVKEPSFDVLEINGSNFLGWRQDMRKHVRALGLEHTLPSAFKKADGNEALTQQAAAADAGPSAPQDETTTVAGAKDAAQAKTMATERACMVLFLGVHLSQGLKDLFVDDEDPDAIWVKLNDKYADAVMAQRSQVRIEWDALGVDGCVSLDD